MRRLLVTVAACGLLGLTACQSGAEAAPSPGVGAADAATVTQIEQRLDAVEHDLDADGS